MRESKERYGIQWVTKKKLGDGRMWFSRCIVYSPSLCELNSYGANNIYSNVDTFSRMI